MNREVRKLAWFIWRHVPSSKDWGRKLLRDWLEWSYERAFVGVIKTRDGRIVAAGVAHPVADAEIARHDAYAFDPNGPCLFADVAVAPDARTFCGLLIMMRKRFGERETIAFKRYDRTRTTEIFQYPYRRVVRSLMRKGITNV